MIIIIITTTITITKIMIGMKRSSTFITQTVWLIMVTGERLRKKLYSKIIYTIIKTKTKTITITKTKTKTIIKTVHIK